MITYEQRLDADPRWALLEGSMHFEENSAVHKSMRKIAGRLDALGIPYAVAGGMALFLHGYRRFTEDVDILVKRQDLQRIHAELEGLGYVAAFTGSKNLRDAESGVRIEFLITGDYPGDGKPKPVAFPDPTAVAVAVEGIHCIELPALLEMKLASGQTNPGRMKDLGDAQEMIRSFQLPEDFAGKLNPFVQDKYKELWRAIHENPADPA